MIVFVCVCDLIECVMLCDMMIVDDVVDVVDVLFVGDGGVTKCIVMFVLFDVCVFEKGDVVIVYYVGLFVMGEMFDFLCECDEVFMFMLGKYEVIDVWDVGVVTMRVGERATLTCASEYAYGD